MTAGAQQRGGPTVTPGPDVVVLDDDDRPLGPGQVGRLARGGHVPIGYYKDPVKTAAMFAEVDGKRYAVPGDLARIEADGSMTLLGRGNTCVNTGGEKVFPEEVEGALKSHPDVFDALVIGVPDERLGQQRRGAGPAAGGRGPRTWPRSRRTSAARSPGYKVPAQRLAGRRHQPGDRSASRLRVGAQLRGQPSEPNRRRGREPPGGLRRA